MVVVEDAVVVNAVVVDAGAFEELSETRAVGSFTVRLLRCRQHPRRFSRTHARRRLTRWARGT